MVSDLDDEKVTPWSPENMQRALKEAGIVVIPVGKKRAKSANRLITAINGGCFVVAEDMPCHDEFKSFCWIGDIGEGLRWALDNPEAAKERTRRGQEHIDKRFSMDAIGPLWRDAIWATKTS